MAGLIRIGRVSNVNYNNGKVAINYADKSDSVSAEMPCLAAGEYNMPAVGDMVAVIYISSGKGICLGAVTDEPLPISGKGNFYKKMGDAHMQTEKGNLSFTYCNGSVSIKDILAMKEKIDSME